MASTRPVLPPASRPIERHFTALFACLDTLEHRLADSRYLVGESLTEADIRLFTTLLRFTPLQQHAASVTLQSLEYLREFNVVYHGHFKCNQRRISDYPNLSNYLRELYQWPGVRRDLRSRAEFKTHYYGSQLAVNPTGI